jgi:hypothetical protein
MSSWSTQQLVEFLAAISKSADERSALRGAVERVAESLEAEAAVILIDGTVAASTGFAVGQIPEGAIAAVSAGQSASVRPLRLSSTFPAAVR